MKLSDCKTKEDCSIVLELLKQFFTRNQLNMPDYVQDAIFMYQDALQHLQDHLPSRALSLASSEMLSIFNRWAEKQGLSQATTISEAYNGIIATDTHIKLGNTYEEAYTYLQKLAKDMEENDA